MGHRPIEYTRASGQRIPKTRLIEKWAEACDISSLKTQTVAFYPLAATTRPVQQAPIKMFPASPQRVQVNKRFWIEVRSLFMPSKLLILLLKKFVQSSSISTKIRQCERFLRPLSALNILWWAVKVNGAIECGGRKPFKFFRWIINGLLIANVSAFN